MKRTLLVLISLAAVTLMAGLAFAYVQPGHLPQTPSNTAPAVVGSGQDATPLPDVMTDPLMGHHHRGGRGCTPPGPTNPVPEPGTMMLASMGLIALGASLRRRRR